MAKQKVNKAPLITGTARNVNTNNIFTKGKKVQANKNIIAQKRTTHPPPPLNEIKRLLAIVMIYKVTSQTDLRRQPERNPTQIQLLFT